MVWGVAWRENMSTIILLLPVIFDVRVVPFGVCVEGGICQSENCDHKLTLPKICAGARHFPPNPNCSKFRIRATRFELIKYLADGNLADSR